MMSRIQKAATAILLGLLVLSAAIWVEVAQPFETQQSAPQAFDGERAMQDVFYQMSLGPRTVGSQAHAQTVDWIVSELEQSGWEAQVQESQALGHPIRNVVGKWGQGRPWIIIGAHYDSRIVADQDTDPENQSLPVPGANDGASGVAVLLELARTLPTQLLSQDQPSPQIWLVFFDAEDNGNLYGWEWILGSRAFVEGLDGKPDAAVVVDMIGDKDLNIYQEHYSDPELTQQIWAQAKALGYEDKIIPQEKYWVLDDHIPFRDAGIPAVDMIDFDYPYWHTRQDTADKVSADSLKVVGDTLTAWLKRSP